MEEIDRLFYKCFLTPAPRKEFTQLTHADRKPGETLTESYIHESFPVAWTEEVVAKFLEEHKIDNLYDYLATLEEYKRCVDKQHYRCTLAKLLMSKE